MRQPSTRTSAASRSIAAILPRAPRARVRELEVQGMTLLKFPGRVADGVIKPMRLDTSLLDGISAGKHAAKSSSTTSHKSSGTSFTSALKAAGSPASADAKKPAAAETTQAVPGHPYAEILTGSRAGMYLNTSHNARAGQTFVMVHRNGVELHVYGTGKNRHVVEMKRHSDPAGAVAKTPATTPATTGTTTSGTTTSGTTTAGKIVTDASTIN